MFNNGTSLREPNGQDKTGKSRGLKCRQIIVLETVGMKWQKWRPLIVFIVVLWISF